MNNNSTRASSLDALRVCYSDNGSLRQRCLGSAGWMMYHAQVGPRSNFVFDGSIYGSLGLTWCFLFPVCHGAAFLFSIGNKYRKGSSRWRIIYDSLLRGFRLTFFAIFIQHIYPW